MEKIIAELINIENKVYSVSESIEEEKKRLPQRIESSKKEIDAAIDTDSEEALKGIRELAIRDANKKVTLILQDSDEKIKQIKAIYEETHEKVEDEIFSKIIGRQ